MNFLNSAILAGLAAALAPLLIHLLNRRRVKTVQFSSVMFLRDLRKTRMRRLQLRRWLLLIVRTLMVALIVMAFARPALKGGVFAALGARARTTAVIALDRSASMALETQNGTAFERAQKRVREIADILGEGDDIIRMPFSGPGAPLASAPSGDTRRVTDQLLDMQIGYGSTDAGQAVMTALDALRTGNNLNREIYLISDLSREGFIRTVLPPARPEDGGVTIYVVDVSEDGGFDLSVDDVKLGDQLLEVGSLFDVKAVVANHATQPVDHLLVSLFIDGRRVAQQDVTVAAGGTATVPFTGSVDSPGIHTGFVEVSADDNPLNNRRYFALHIPDRIRILLASDYPSGRIAARLALAPQPQARKRLSIEETDTDALLGRNFFDYDCVVITEWRRPEASVVNRLLRYVRAGGGVFLAPTADADTTAWNRLIAGPQYGLRLGPDPAPPDPERYFIWDHYNWNHPVWSVYRDVRRDRIPEIHWYAIYRTKGTPRGQSLVQFSGGHPALTEVRLDAGKLITLWSSPNTPYTNLPLRSPFVPFMHRLVEYLAADVSERRGDFLVGEMIEREPSQTVGGSADIRLIGPDGVAERPRIEWAGQRIKVRVGPRDLPGVYTLTADDKPIDAFAVNIDPKESVPDRIDRAELRRRWPGYNLVFIDPHESLPDVVKKTRYGTEIRGAFLWAVLGLFLLEMVIARARRRDLPITAQTGGPAIAQRQPQPAD